MKQQMDKISINRLINSIVTWSKAWTIYRNPKVITLLFFGFSSGLPFMLIFSSLSFWLREAGVDRSTIGFFSWVGLSYAFKWVWAPLIDRMPLPFLTSLLGRRRSWLFLAQCAVMFFLICMSQTNPVSHLWHMAAFALGLSFSSASQDIVIDAYRIESAPQKLQAAMAAAYQIGFRIAMIVSGAGTLAISAWVGGDNTGYNIQGWSVAYLSMAALFLVGILTTLLSPEPKINTPKRPMEKKAAIWLENNQHLPHFIAKSVAWFYGTAVCPFADFFLRYRWHAVLLLLLIGTYRISDIVMGVMANSFYYDTGFTKEQIAAVSKVYGVIMTLLGASFGGLLISRFGVMKILFVGALLSSVSNLLFSLLTYTGPDLLWLSVVISLDNLSGGLATSAFIAWLSGLTNVNYSATQYALFSSVMLLFPKFIAGFSGVAVNHMGYFKFFIASALIGLPVLILIFFANRYLKPLGNNKNDIGR